jgi:hypothetical protein
MPINTKIENEIKIFFFFALKKHKAYTRKKKPNEKKKFTKLDLKKNVSHFYLRFYEQKKTVVRKTGWSCVTQVKLLPRFIDCWVLLFAFYYGFFPFYFICF